MGRARAPWHEWHPLVAASVVRRHLAPGPRHAADVGRRLLPESLRRLVPAPEATVERDPRAWPGREAAAAEARGRTRRAEHHRGELALLRPAEPAAGPRRTPSTDPTAVVHLVTTALPEVVAGYTVRTQRIARAQADAGQSVDVVTRLGFPVTRGRLRAGSEVVVDGVRHHRLIARVPARADHALARDVVLTTVLAARLGAGVLHAHSAHPNAQVAFGVRAHTGLPVVYEVRGFQEETRRSADPEQRVTEHHRLTRDVETWCAQRADAVVTLSASMRDELAARGVDPARVHLAPNAVDPAWLTVGDAERAAAARLRDSLRLAPDTLVVAAVGTMNGYEGLDVLLDALTSPLAPPAHVLLVGGGPERDRLARRAAAEGLPVTLPGAVPPDDVRRWLLAADVVALPRLDLPVTRLVPPLKPVEAMGLGIPVVASDLPPLAELVTHGTTGLLVPPGDPAALAAALRVLAADPDLRRRLGAAAAQHVSATRTWPAVAAGYRDLYRSLHPALQETP